MANSYKFLARRTPSARTPTFLVLLVDCLTLLFTVPRDDYLVVEAFEYCTASFTHAFRDYQMAAAPKCLDIVCRSATTGANEPGMSTWLRMCVSLSWSLSLMDLALVRGRGCGWWFPVLVAGRALDRADNGSACWLHGGPTPLFQHALLGQ